MAKTPKYTAGGGRELNSELKKEKKGLRLVATKSPINYTVLKSTVNHLYSPVSFLFEWAKRIFAIFKSPFTYEYICVRRAWVW